MATKTKLSNKTLLNWVSHICREVEMRTRLNQTMMSEYGVQDMYDNPTHYDDNDRQRISSERRKIWGWAYDE